MKTHTLSVNFIKALISFLIFKKVKEKLAQMNNEEGHKAQEATACTITDLILHEIEKNPV